MTNIDKLIQIGGKEWEKGSNHRIYFDNLEKWYGLTYDTYNTGNISNAKLDGESISNSQANKILKSLTWAKLYYDANTDKFYHNIDTAIGSKIIKNLRNEMEA